MSAVDRIEKLAVRLYNDLEEVDNGLPIPPNYEPPEGMKQQKLQLILDAFEQVGQVALDNYHATPWKASSESFNTDAPQQEQTPH